jgi:hypothetical protein
VAEAGATEEKELCKSAKKKVEKAFKQATAKWEKVQVKAQAMKEGGKEGGGNSANDTALALQRPHTIMTAEMARRRYRIIHEMVRLWFTKIADAPNSCNDAEHLFDLLGGHVLVGEQVRTEEERNEEDKAIEEEEEEKEEEECAYME